MLSQLDTHLKLKTKQSIGFPQGGGRF